MKTVLALSGGLDSTCLLAKCISNGHAVHPVIFSYGSKHNKYENQAAQSVCDFYELKPTFLDLTALMRDFKSNLLLSGGKIPEGHYADETMKKTVVPGRNLIFISILAGLAESIDTDIVALAVHSGDHAIYPDCRPEFIARAAEAVMHSSDYKVSIYTPFLHIDKGEVLREGLYYKAPIHLTRTCYKNQPIPCGACGACVERAEAFESCNTNDPVLLRR